MNGLGKHACKQQDINLGNFFTKHGRVLIADARKWGGACVAFRFEIRAVTFQLA